MPGRHRRPVPAAPRPASATARVLFPVLAAFVVAVVVVVPIAWVAKRLQSDFHPAVQGSLSSTGPPVTVTPSPTPTFASSSASPVRPSPARPAPARTPPPAGAARSSPPPLELATLRLWVTGDASWVHVSAPGRLLAERRMVHGQTAYFAASRLFAILGNAGAVLVSVNGAPMRPAGAVGQAVRGTIYPG